MAQADSVPSSSHQLITGESARQSTNLRAVNLPTARDEPANRGYLIGGSHVSAIIGGDEARPFRLWREKRGDQPEDLLKRRYYGADAGQGPVGSNIVALFYVTAAFFLGRLLRIVLIRRRFVSGNKRLRNGALDKLSSNQLVHGSDRRISGENSGRTKSSEIESFNGHQGTPPLLHRRLGRPDHHG